MNRDGLAQLLEGENDLVVPWKAETAGRALDIVQKEQPDLVITDITLPDKNGLELIKDIQAIRPQVPILVVSMHEESLYAERALKAGARGYITKQEGGEQLMRAVREVLGGSIYVSPQTGTRILELFSGSKPRNEKSLVGVLTDREFEVYHLIGEGKSTKEIAVRLHLSEKTVAVHRVHIKDKLRIATAGELVHHAIRWVETQRSAS